MGCPVRNIQKLREHVIFVEMLLPMSFPCPLVVQVESPMGCCCYQRFTLVAWNTRITFHIYGMRKKSVNLMCLCNYFHLGLCLFLTKFRDMSTKRTSECLLLLLHICGAIVSSHQHIIICVRSVKKV